MKNFESESIEYKQVTTGVLPADLWETICAFSNGDGGDIYLGVDNNGSKLGIESKYLDRIQNDINSLFAGCFNHKIYPDIAIESNNVVRIHVNPVPAQLRPIYSKKRGVNKGGRVRVGSSNIEIDDEWLRRFSIAAKGGAELTVPNQTINFIDCFDTELVQVYIKKVQDKRGEVFNDLTKKEIFRKMRAINENGNPTLFGLLAFGKNTTPQDLLAPTVNIAITQYSGTDKINALDPSEVSLDDKEFNGNIVSQFELALKHLLTKLPVRSRIDNTGKRQDYLTIPRLALREILANALVHRDYSTFSSRIQVDIYIDRIEFSNPGRSLVPLDLIETAHPETRNPLLMSYLRDLDITEHRGRGIRTIKTLLERSGLKQPIFAHKHDWFVATVFTSAFINQDTQKWLESLKSFNFNEKQLKAIAYLKSNPLGISNSDYRIINNMNSVRDDIRAKKELAKIVKSGVFLTIGEKRYRKYLLNKEYDI